MDNERKIKRQSNFLSNLFKTPSEKSELSNLLLSMQPFKDLNSKELDQLYCIMHDRVYAQSEYVFYQGDPSIALYIVFEGEIELISAFDSSRKLVISKYFKGDFFGELALLEDEKRIASAMAVKDSKLLVIFKPDLDEFIDKFPKKGIKLLKGLSQIFATRLRNLNKEYINLYFKNGKEMEVADGISNKKNPGAG
ncbi:MAG: cyclic nucleotide-binding domain-containing protein [Bacillota bacterium]